MIFSTISKKSSNSTHAIDDAREIAVSNAIVYFNEDTLENDITIDHYPKGEIISIVITVDSQDMIVDGRPSIAGKKLSVLKGENFHGASAEVKYMI